MIVKFNEELFCPLKCDPCMTCPVSRNRNGRGIYCWELKEKFPNEYKKLAYDWYKNFVLKYECIKEE